MQELTKYRWMNGSQWNNGGALERRGRSEFPDRRKWSAKQVISGQVRENESVTGWMVSIEVSKDKNVGGVRKDVRIEGSAARIRRSASDRRGIEVKEW